MVTIEGSVQQQKAASFRQTPSLGWLSKAMEEEGVLITLDNFI